MMRVVVLGSGVIGVTSAWYLAEAGHEVVVLDRQAGPALETSFANAGEVSPGYSSPWAAPGLPIKALQWLFMRHRPLVIWPMPDPAMIAWGLRLLMNCTSARYELNKSRMVPIAEYSRDLLRELRGRARPRLRRAGAGHAAAVPQAGAARRHRQGHRGPRALRRRPTSCSTSTAASRVEPALARVREKFAGGLRLPGDETGDCFKFTSALAAVCRQQGVEFRYGTAIRGHRDRARPGHRRRHRRRAGHRRRLRRGAGQLLAQAAAPDRRAGAGLPGQGLLAHRADHRSGRRAGIHGHGRDPQGGDHAARRPHPGRRHGRARGYNTKLRQARRGTLEHVVTDLYPDGGDVATAEFWCGLRPMTPDGPPVIGPTKYPEPLAQHRPRHAGLDHGLRLRPRARRPASPAATPEIDDVRARHWTATPDAPRHGHDRPRRLAPQSARGAPPRRRRARSRRSSRPTATATAPPACCRRWPRPTCWASPASRRRWPCARPARTSRSC